MNSFKESIGLSRVKACITCSLALVTFGGNVICKRMEKFMEDNDLKSEEDYRAKFVKKFNVCRLWRE